MNIRDKGPVDGGLPQAIRNGSFYPVREENDRNIEQRSTDAAKMSISSEARYLQQAAVLAKRGDDLRARKVEEIKAKILTGQYSVAPEEVAKAMLREEVARIMGEA